MCKLEECPACDGDGQNGGQYCSVCDATGKVQVFETYKTKDVSEMTEDEKFGSLLRNLQYYKTMLKYTVDHINSPEIERYLGEDKIELLRLEVNIK